MTRALILGSTGRLGRLLRHHWPKDTQLDLIWHGRRAAATLCFDLKDTSKLSDAMTQADIILNLAGNTPATSDDMEANIDIANRVFSCAGELPVITASSAAVYGERTGDCAESDEVTPISNYGRAKLRVEQLSTDHSGPSCAIRIGNVVGADALFAERRSHYVLHQFADGRTPMRSFINPSLLAQVLDSLMTCMLHGGTVPSVLNIASPEPVEMSALLDAAGLEWSAEPAPSHAIARVALDTCRIQALFDMPVDASLPQKLMRDWLNK